MRLIVTCISVVEAFVNGSQCESSNKLMCNQQIYSYSVAALLSLYPSHSVCLRQVYLLQLCLELLYSLPRLSVSTASRYDLTWSTNISSARAVNKCNHSTYLEEQSPVCSDSTLLILVLTVDHSVSDCSIVLFPLAEQSSPGVTDVSSEVDSTPLGV